MEMGPRFKNFLIRLLTLLTLSALLAACQDTIPQRTTITPKQKVKTGDGKGDDDGEAQTRPTNAIIFKSDFCGCKNAKPITYGNCKTFCAGKNTSVQTFYANFTVTEAISLGGLGNVFAWCQTPLPDEETNPKCVLEAKDEDNNIINLDVNPIPNANSITANLENLLEDKTYVLTLVESNSQARSNSIQIVKYSSDLPIPVLGPLKVAPISQYTCIFRGSYTSGGDIYYDNASRVHYYFHPRLPHPPLVGSLAEFFCHDIMTYGSVDDVGIPRLELVNGVYNLWDTTDPRFYDNDGNGILDVDDIIAQKARNFGRSSLPSGVKFFVEFPLKGSPQESVQDENNKQEKVVQQPLGHYMLPWINQATYKSFCLTSNEYNSEDPLFKALRDVIGVDTEGIYIGQKAPETLIDKDGQPFRAPDDFILVRESDLKRAWFYLKNGVPTAPTDANVANVAVYFYYPFNFNSPFIKASTQRIYQVKGANELSTGVQTGGNGQSGTSTNYPPHDRKIGCVPKF
jgi:hypothetical protein